MKPNNRPPDNASTDDFVTFTPINRAVVTLKAKQPFLDWLESLPDRAPGETFSLEAINDDQTAFLIPEFEDSADAVKYIESIAPAIFQDQLESWWTDDTHWPKDPTLKMFYEWFDVNIHSIVVDTLEEDVEKTD